MHLPRRTYLILLAGATAWCAAILLAPYLASASSWYTEFLYRFFHPICHQLPGRSFHLFGEPLGVCSRCASIYFAFLAGTLAYPFFHRRVVRPVHDMLHPRNVLMVAVLPMVLDAGLEMLGLRESTFLTRTLTGGVFGLVVPFIILPAALEGVQQIVASPHSASMNN